jgi:hypothetical protein
MESKTTPLPTRQPHISKPAIQVFLCQIKYPISYLGFETFATAVPLFDNLSPFEQVPFQKMFPLPEVLRCMIVFK